MAETKRTLSPSLNKKVEDSYTLVFERVILGNPIIQELNFESLEACTEYVLKFHSEISSATAFLHAQKQIKEVHSYDDFLAGRSNQPRPGDPINLKAGLKKLLARVKRKRTQLQASNRLKFNRIDRHIKLLAPLARFEKIGALSEQKSNITRRTEPLRKQLSKDFQILENLLAGNRDLTNDLVAYHEARIAIVTMTPEHPKAFAGGLPNPALVAKKLETILDRTSQDTQRVPKLST